VPEVSLASEPVSAQPPSRSYLAKKFVRRNKSIVLTCGLIFFILTASTFFSSWLYLREKRAHEEAVAAEEKQLKLQNQTVLLQNLAEEREKFMSAEEAYENGHRDSADEIIDGIKSFQPGPDHVALYRELGDWHAMNNRWGKATDRFAVIFQINCNAQKVPTLDDQRYGVLLVAQGRLREFEKFRQGLIARNNSIESVQSAQRLIRFCLLMPAEKSFLQNLGDAAALVQDSLRDDGKTPENNWENSAFTLALLAYRQARFNESANWCAQALAHSGGAQPRDTNVKILKAMSDFRIGNKSLAESELDVCKKTLDDSTKVSDSTTQPHQNDWYLWLNSKVYLQEAESLIRP
jgi:eukaryotic-like serine/threonine-protein kinase